MTAPPNPSEDRDAAGPEAGPRIWLSALADGERDAITQGAVQWRDDPAARETWYLYHLIGDVLRSDDLSSTPARDAAFLLGLRERLAREPVPLAPAPVPVSQSLLVRRLGWRAPAAVAAGFVAVAATLVLMRPDNPADQGGAGDVASVAGTGVRVLSNPHPSATGALVADGLMIRDARLDAYLRAHQAARGSSPAALPGGGMRNAEILVTPPGPQVALPVFRTASEPR